MMFYVSPNQLNIPLSVPPSDWIWTPLGVWSTVS